MAMCYPDLLTDYPDRIAVASFEAQAALIEAERKKDDIDLLDVISEGTPVSEIINEVCKDTDLRDRLDNRLWFY